MAAFENRWGEDQREAIARAYCDLGHRFSSITRAAQAGELTLDGEKLDPFPIPYASVREIARREEKKRAGRAHSALVNQPPKTANEMIRRRLVSLLDHDTNRLERDVEKNPKKPVDAEHLRKLARALFELERLGTVRPTPAAPLRPTTPEREDGIAGRVLAAIAPQGINGETAEGRIYPTDSKGQSEARATGGDSVAGGEVGERGNGGEGEAPVSYARAQIAQLTARVDVPADGPREP